MIKVLINTVLIMIVSIYSGLSIVLRCACACVIAHLDVKSCVNDNGMFGYQLLCCHGQIEWHYTSLNVVMLCIKLVNSIL